MLAVSALCCLMASAPAGGAAVAEVVAPARAGAGVVGVSTHFARFTRLPDAQFVGLEIEGRLGLPAGWSLFARMPFAAGSTYSLTPRLVGLGNFTAGVQNEGRWRGFEAAVFASLSAPTASRYGAYGKAARSVAVSQVLRDASLYQPDTATVRLGGGVARTWGRVTAAAGGEARRVEGLYGAASSTHGRGLLAGRWAWTERIATGMAISAMKRWGEETGGGPAHAWIYGAEAWAALAGARYTFGAGAQLPLDPESRRIGVYGFGVALHRSLP